MTVETATYLGDLNATYPAGSDARSEGDDHIRLLKTVLKATFPYVTGALTATHTELNYVDGVTSAIQTQLDAKAPLASPAFTTSATIDGVSIRNASILNAGSIADARVPSSNVTQHQASLSIAATQLTGSIANARVPASNVTQHQASLSIAATQLTGSIADARVPASNVTQHQASLAIAADQVTLSIRNVSGTTDSPTSSDEENIVTLSSASPTTVTLNSGVCAVGNSIAFQRLGAGTVTFAAGGSQTVNSPGSRLTIPDQYGTVVATYRATNTWILSGV